jgi:hypothetical protein
VAFEIKILDGKLWHCSFCLGLSAANWMRLYNALLRVFSCEFVDRPTATEKRSANSH